jgi:hypothetical protein
VNWLGILPDIAWIPPFSGLNLSEETLMAVNGLFIVAVLGCFLFSLAQIIYSKASTALLLAMVPLAAFLPFLIAGASNRFLIPVIPFVVLTIVNSWDIPLNLFLLGKAASLSGPKSL